MDGERRAVIFDVDGVLIDSYEAHFKSWQFVAQELGYSMSEEQFAMNFGRTSRDIIKRLFDPRLDASDIEKIDGRKEQLFRHIIDRQFPAMKGASELIDDLLNFGFLVAVGSSGPPENVSLVLQKLGVESRIHAVVNGMDVERGKPDPQVFQLAAEKLSIDPSQCAVIEDAPAGVEATIAADMTSIALVSTGHQASELNGADVVITSLRQIDAKSIARFIDRRYMKLRTTLPL